MIAQDLGRHIRQRRNALGISQKVLCEKARVSRAVLSKLESERGSPVQTDVLDRLLAALEMNAKVGIGAGHAGRTEERLHQRLREEESRQRHLRLALDLCTNPKGARIGIRRALEQVDIWEQRKACSPQYIERWRNALSRDPRHVALAMSSFGEWENAMFQNSPWSFKWN